LEDAFMRRALALFRALEKSCPKPPAPEGAHKVLICKWCCMGDAILSLYAIREFKRHNPEVRVEVLVSSRIRDVYANAPEIDAVHVLPITGRRLALELMNPRLWVRLLSLLFRLRRAGFSQFIDLELYRANGAVLKRLLGIPYSRGFSVPGAPPKGHDFEAERPREMPEWQCFYRVLGLEVPRGLPEPLYPRAAHNGGPRARRVGIVYGSSFNWPQKKWPWEYYAEVITLLEPAGCRFVLLGSAFEKEEGKKIAGKARGSIEDTSGALDYRGLMREVAACDLVVGNDTGTLHLAAAFGIPTVTLFGPTDPRKWNGLTSTALFLSEVPCRPCYYLSSMPPCSHFDCLRKMRPAMVAERIRGALAALPAP
jgi:heptosyltransferase-2